MRRKNFRIISVRGGNKMKIILVGQPKCMPCFMMKNQINDKLDDIDAEFEYVDLNELGEEKEAFIRYNRIMCTPTTLFKDNDNIVAKLSGLQDVDTLISKLKEIK